MTSSDSQYFTVKIAGRDGQPVMQFPARRGTLLWFHLRKHGLSIGAACSGVGVCGACDVKISSSEKLDPESDFEKETKQRNGVKEHLRLACLVRVWSDMVVQSQQWIPPSKGS